MPLLRASGLIATLGLKTPKQASTRTLGITALTISATSRTHSRSYLLIPDAKQYNPDPQYLAELIVSTGLTQPQLAAIIGHDPRTIRRWLAGDRKFPYSLQFMLEVLVLEV